MISQAQPTVLFRPQVPIPVEIVYIIQPIPQRKATSAIENTIHQDIFAIHSTGAATTTETSRYDFNTETKALQKGAS